MPENNYSEVCQRLGEIKGTIDSIERQNGRTTLALIGVITAQIGVKILGTPILLDIATYVGITAGVLLLGVILRGWRIFRTKHHKLTTTGWSFALLMSLIVITQIVVYLSDLGMGLFSREIFYISRIFQNISMLWFGWRFLAEPELFCRLDKQDDSK